MSRLMRVGKYKSIGEAYENDPWVHKFIAGLCDYYGYPASSAECNSKNERFMHAWAMMNIVWALREYKILWIDGIGKYDIPLLIDTFTRSVYELAGRDVIPPYYQEEVIKGLRQ